MKTREEHVTDRNRKPASNDTLAEILLDIRELLIELVGKKK